MSYTPPDHLALNKHVNTVVGNHPIDPTTQRAEWCAAGKRQIDLILDEAKELRDGIELSKQGEQHHAKARQEIRDGVADVIVTLDGLVHRLSLNLPDLTIVIENHDRAPVDKYEYEWLLNHLQVLEQMLAELCADSEKTIDFDALYSHLFDAYEATYDLARAWDININADQVAVYESNMSKFDLDKATAMTGVLKYAELGVKTDLFPNDIDGQTYYVIKCVEDCVDSKGKTHRAGKFLKSVNFREPVLL